LYLDVATVLVRTQISLDAEEHRRAKRRAAELDISLAEYVRRAVSRELASEKPHPKSDISAIIALGSSAEPTNIARTRIA
jgi:hypothetical protein